MGTYNLLDEKWIMVLREDTGRAEKVSLKEVFAHAGEYYDLAGEIKTQNFAVLRVLLAVLETVFSRFDSEGKPYDFVELNMDRFRQLKPVNCDEDIDEDDDPYFDTWKDLWEKGEFPGIVQEYLEAWRDHFNLYDDKYPFYQVTPEEMKTLVKKNSQGEFGTQIYGKNINRTISESRNKIAMFAPADGEAKEILQNDELARWLIMFQGYIGTGAKVKVQETEATCSKGWLYDLGGVYLRGNNLFETLMLNCILSAEYEKNLDGEIIRAQIPSWERSPLENVDVYFNNQADNRATLYTSWSSAIAFKEGHKEEDPFWCFAGKLPEIRHTDNFIEPMTCWKWNEKNQQGKDVKNKFTPLKHNPSEAVWRNFNVLMGVNEEENEHYRRPGIISWYRQICKDNSMKKLRHYKITICSVSMQDDGIAASWVPSDEITDEIQMETAVFASDEQDDWIEQINTVVNESKSCINQTLGRFVGQVALIRKSRSSDTPSPAKQGTKKSKKKKASNSSSSKKKKSYQECLQDKERENLYQEVDWYFREWLSGLKDTDTKNEKALAWYGVLEKAIRSRADEIFRDACYRDFKGITADGKFTNIAVARNELDMNLARCKNK